MDSVRRELSEVLASAVAGGWLAFIRWFGGNSEVHTYNGNPLPQLEHLSDRELLVLAVREVNEIKITTIFHNNRLRSLERWRYILSGGLIVVALIAGWVIQRLP